MPQQDFVKYPDYITNRSRLDSFAGWPKPDVITAEALATAGFFFTGQNDSVKCFSCGGGMRHWEHGDHPWVVHAESFSWCNFVKAEKGPEFIEEHKKVYDQNGPEEPDEEENLEFACKVCREKNSNTLLLPCSHLVCCDTCAPQVMQCIVCQVQVLDRIRVHMS